MHILNISICLTSAYPWDMGMALTCPQFFLKRLQALNLGHLHTAIHLTPGIIGGVGNGVLAAELTGRTPCLSFAEDTDDLFVGKTLLHGDVLMCLMKTNH